MCDLPDTFVNEVLIYFLQNTLAINTVALFLYLLVWLNIRRKVKGA
jgi:hypothetical protein